MPIAKRIAGSPLESNLSPYYILFRRQDYPKRNKLVRVHPSQKHSLVVGGAQMSLPTLDHGEVVIRLSHPNLSWTSSRANHLTQLTPF